jgi:hypothetical protein
MGQENKKPTINKNTLTQGTFSASSSQTNRTPNEQERAKIIEQYKEKYKQLFTDLLAEKIEKDELDFQMSLFQISNSLLLSIRERKKIQNTIQHELFESNSESEKPKECETSRTPEQEKRANYRRERKKILGNYLDDLELKGYEKNTENYRNFLSDLDQELELLRKNFNYEGFDEAGSYFRTESTDDETESNPSNFSGYESGYTDESDDEETEQTAEQSNEVIPVIPKITPDQYLYAPGEKEQYEKVIPVIEKVIEVVEKVIPKKDKGKAKETETEQPENSENTDEIDDDELQED